MRRAALAVLLTFFVPVLLLAQHHASEGGSSSSSSHSSSSSGSSSSSSGNHSGGGSHAGTGVSSSSHTGSSSVGSHSGSGGSSPRSGARTDIADSAHASRISSLLAPTLNPGLASVSGASSRLASVVGEAWIQEPIRLHHESGYINKALREGKFDAELRELGLEPNKEAYRVRLASLGESDTTIAEKKPNWFAKTFLGKRDADGEAARPKPCKGKHCKPAPPPPGPHPTPPPAPIVGSGAGFCWGYLERCDRRGNCYAHLRSVDYSRCDLILRQLREEEARAAAFETDLQTACSADALSIACATAKSNVQQAESQVVLLRKQYKMCLSAAMPLLSNNWQLLQSINGSP